MRKQIVLIFALCFSQILTQNTYDTTATYTCIQENASGRCVKWQQTMYTSQGVSCFPYSTKVMTPSGLRPLGEIKTGEKILGLVDGTQSFTTVTSWLHHDHESIADFMQVTVGDSHFQVSAKHNVALDDLSYKFGDELQGEFLYDLGKVDSVNKVQNHGIFAPKTKSNNFFVYLEGQSSQKKALAHCFAHIRYPTTLEPLFEFVQKTWDFFSPSNQTVHPSYIWMQKTFTFAQE